ncbi:uncharacterized protein K02A2.6-like [Anopheles gambiae]|uniref:uncharacterized protein K02A2.6-like n=1 Tax=Anopheles gambiae TaxID=7165 RepID=UPI002AC89A9E|nr:uncharacterized protein K02A2.6-like [Anopheles gambiae]
MGLCTKGNVNLQLKEHCRPVFCPKRPVAYAMLDAVDKELDRLQQLGVITPVDYSDWAAPIVVVRKANGQIRICGDYSTGLNGALHPQEYPLPLPADIFAKLGNCTHFTQIDLTDAFLQVEIAEQSRSLLTINTHKGLYSYNRLPPGIKVAPAAFQQLMDKMLVGLRGVSSYMDDIIVGVRNQEEHDETLLQTLGRIQEYGFTIRVDKCSFNKSQIRYLGHIIDRNGISPDPSKVEAIINLPAPSDVSEVRSFLGALNYYGRFIPNLRNLRNPLDALLKEGKQFDWSAECQKVFEKFKTILSSNLALTHYDPRFEIIVSADASSVGLGATLSHRMPDGTMKVVQHASRSLTKAEQGYSQIDREGLSIIFAVTKFHKMIFGRHFRLQTDHRPLLRIFGNKKGIPVYTANRLQRFTLTLLMYDFQIEYISTENFGNADILSRLISKHNKPDEDYIIANLELERDVKSVVISNISSLPISFMEIAKQTLKDPILCKIFHFIQKGWPQNTTYAGELSRFYARREALSAVENCILFGERVVIPNILQQRCLRQFHRGHPGIQRMKSLARSYVYWPSIDSNISECVASCEKCQTAAKTPAHSPHVPWPKSSSPWQRVHIDYAGPVEGDYFLIIVDAYSKWPEVIKTSSTTASATIAILRGIFARFGIPVTLVSDNGTQFTSGIFADFCTSNGIQHLRTAPFHPQSNGQAERFVDTFKRAMKKICSDDTSLPEAIDLFLQTYRSTPNPAIDENKSPAEVMLGRQMRTCFDLLRPTAISNEPRVPDNMRVLHCGELVYVKTFYRNNWKWEPAIVTKRCGSVMYEVKTSFQRILRRHINQMRRRSVSFHQSNRPSQPMALDVLLGTWNVQPRTSPISRDVNQCTPLLSSVSSPNSKPASFASSPSSSPSSTLLSTSESASSTSSPSSSSSLYDSSSVYTSCSPTPEEESPVLLADNSSAEQLEDDNGGTQLVQAPRRSSRNKRPPRWLNQYQLS